MKTMFQKAIVKTPCANMVKGITEADLGRPDYDLALKQHHQYIQALQQCGLEVTVLPADDAYPDSCFVEDPAVITTQCAIITNPGAISRQGETQAIAAAVSEHFQSLNKITAPATLDGGDVMMVGNYFYIGLSDRTNKAGAEQLIQILRRYGMDGKAVMMNDMLHLKTGISYLENNKLLATGEFIEHPVFAGFEILPVAADESYAANSLWINGKVIVPQGHPKTQTMIEQAGYEVITIDVSEFQKLDGGLSCLSLRF